MVLDVFSDLITTVLFRSYFLSLSFDHNEPDDVFQQSVLNIFNMHVLFTFQMESDILHSCVLIRENTLLLTVLSVIFRCSTEVLLLWSMRWECDWATMYKKQAHCVSMNWMFCCVTEKSLLTFSLPVMIDIMMLFVWTRPLANEAVRSSQMILEEYVEFN